MFMNCSSLNEIRIAYTGNFSGQDVPTDAFANWVNNVSSTGTFYYDGEDTTTGVNAIPTGWEVKKYSVPDGLRFTARDGGETVRLFKNGSAPSCSFQYSTDGEQTWNDLTLGRTFTLANAGDTISFRAKNAQSTLAYNWDRNHKFQLGSTGHLSVDGSFYALLRQDWKTAPKSGWMGTKSLRALFSDVTGEFDITNVQPLDWAPTIDCYGGMFYFANINGAVPHGLLPSTTLAQDCYQAMFQGASITNAPDLPATTSTASGVYKYMFQDTSNLSTAGYIGMVNFTGSNACERMFKVSNVVSVQMNDLVTASGTNMMTGIFEGCPNLKRIEVRKLSNTSGSWNMNAFAIGASSLEVVDWSQATQVPAIQQSAT